MSAFEMDDDAISAERTTKPIAVENAAGDSG